MAKRTVDLTWVSENYGEHEPPPFKRTARLRAPPKLPPPLYMASVKELAETSIIRVSSSTADIDNAVVLSTSSRESSAEAAVSRRAVTSRKPCKELTQYQEGLLAKMIHDDKTWAEIGRHFPGHTEGGLLHEARGEASEAGGESLG
ncbi:hypothetical protein BKA64DRAFT_210543 [Cadophora sp. MPI-SDFR-AT-0126]|nr:hypothetical protein BKA64DRAFT_210543 [Leotiomycetes sp. MPI-SDFR-AT-0126]